MPQARGCSKAPDGGFHARLPPCSADPCPTAFAPLLLTGWPSGL